MNRGVKCSADLYTELAIARDEARAAGRQEGRQEGLAEGQISRIQSHQRLLGVQVTPLADLRPLSAAELDGLGSRLEAELSAKLGNDREATQE